jgi:hypothetical protein
MTQTTHSNSWAFTIVTEYYLKIFISETKDNLSLLHLVLDSLITLNEKLSRLNYVIQRKDIGLNFYWKGVKK